MPGAELRQEPSYVHREDCGLPATDLKFVDRIVDTQPEHICQVADPLSSQTLISRKKCNCIDSWKRTLESRMDFMLKYADMDCLSPAMREAVLQLYDSTD